MITSKPQGDNVNLYNEMFAKAKRDYDKEYKTDISITDLESFFHYVRQLAEINPNFTRLPLDEEPFRINGNTRSIIIPEAFKKLAGVSGDHTAETIWFEVDRYFDAIDLQTQNVYIEWKHLTTGKKGLHAPYTKDYESRPNKILFPWVLTKDVTTPGVVEFSVRFYTLDNETIDYSLGTLSAKINISDTLNFDLTPELEDEINILTEKDGYNSILKRLSNNIIYGGQYSGQPIIFVDLDNKTHNKNVVLLTAVDKYPKRGNAEGYDIVCGEMELLDDEGEANILKASGSSPDSGKITYRWQKADLNFTTGIEWGSIGADYIHSEYVKTLDTEYNENKQYYIENPDYPSGHPFIEFGAESEDVDAEQMKKLYEYLSTYTPDSVGYYKVEITNTVGVAVDKDGKPVPTNPSSIDTKVVRIPKAQKVGLGVGPYITRLNSDYVDGKEEVTLQAKNVTNIPTKGTIKYHWYKEENGKKEQIDETNNDSYSLIGENVEGTYYLQIHHNRNNTVSQSDYATYAVVAQAQQAKIIEDSYPPSLDGNPMIPINQEINIVLDSTVPSTNVRYDWYCSSEPNGTFEKVYQQYSKELNTREGEYTISFTPKKTGYYKVSIKNYYWPNDDDILDGRNLDPIESKVISVYSINV